MSSRWKISAASLLGLISAAPSVLAARLGDVNHDGSVNAADIVLLSRHLREGTALGAGASEADMAPLGNPDGEVNAADLALLGRIVAPCAAAASACIAVRDKNGDGDIGPDVQEAINRLLWPNGNATEAAEVILAAPWPGVWTMSRPLRICGSATVPSGTEPPLCDGTNPPAATIVWDGLWSAVTMGCDLGDPLPNPSQCLRIGDGWNDGLEDAQLTSIRFEGTPTIEVWRAPPSSAPVGNLTALWCDGCTGSLRAIATIEDHFQSPPFPIPLATGTVLAGPRLFSDIELRPGHFADGVAPLDFFQGIAIEGRQEDSVAKVRIRMGTQYEMGSTVGSRLPIAFFFAGEQATLGASDGCDYNGRVYSCAGLKLVNDVEGVATWAIGEADGIVIDGHISTPGPHPPFSFRGDPVRAVIQGTVECDSQFNACIRASGPDLAQGALPDSSYHDIFVDAQVRRIGPAATTPSNGYVQTSSCSDPPRGGVNFFLGWPPFSPPDALAGRNGKITLGPAFSFTPADEGDDAVRCDDGGYTTSYNATDHAASVGDWGQPVAALPAMCVRLDGTPGLLECSDARTKITATQRSWVSRFRVEATEVVPASRTCDLSVKIAGVASSKWFLTPIPFGASGLRQPGDYAEQYINDAFVDPEPVQVAVLPPSASSATRCPSPPCTCSGVGGLAVTIGTFPLAQGPPLQ